MRTHEILGGWYGDIGVNGEYVVTVPGQPLQTHQGAIDLPFGEPWGVGYPRLTVVGGFRFAGQAHSETNLTWQWRNGWHRIEGPCVGVSPVIYDLNGVPVISDGSVGVNGYRFVDRAGRIWTGDETYGPWHGLSQWSEIGDGLYIGQCHESNRDEALIYDARTGKRHLLCAERSFFIRRSAKADDAVGICLSLPDRKPAAVRLIWTTFSELRALPVYLPSGPQQPEPPEPPVPEPWPEPEPEPPDEEPPVSTQEQWERWMNVELPHLLDIYQERHGGVRPDGHWGAFQTARRGITVPEGPWTYEQMVQHEQAQGSDPTNPPEPP